MSNMNFNCDVCGREVQGYTFVNGMKFCAKCYQETFGETEKDRKIDDLQSQLAITERALELCERHHIGFEESTVKEQVDWRETRIKENIEYFKTKAKEMLEND